MTMALASINFRLKTPSRAAKPHMWMVSCGPYIAIPYKNVCASECMGRNPCMRLASSSCIFRQWGRDQGLADGHTYMHACMCVCTQARKHARWSIRAALQLWDWNCGVVGGGWWWEGNGERRAGPYGGFWYMTGYIWFHWVLGVKWVFPSHTPSHPAIQW